MNKRQGKYHVNIYISLHYTIYCIILFYFNERFVNTYKYLYTSVTRCFDRKSINFDFEFLWNRLGFFPMFSVKQPFPNFKYQEIHECTNMNVLMYNIQIRWKRQIDNHIILIIIFSKFVFSVCWWLRFIININVTWKTRGQMQSFERW